MNDDIEKQKKQKRVRLIIQIIVIILLLAMAVGFTIYLLPIFVRIQKDEAFRNTVVEYISRLGNWSWIALIFIQVIQAILCVIPAGPVVILTGMLYNSFIAVIITIVGQTLGALAIIWLVKIISSLETSCSTSIIISDKSKLRKTFVIPSIARSL